MLSNNTKMKIVALMLDRHRVKPNLFRDISETGFAVFKGLYNAFKGVIKPLVKEARGLTINNLLEGALIALLALIILGVSI